MLSGQVWEALATTRDNSISSQANKVHYLKRLRKNHHMATDGKGQFAVGNIVLIADFRASKKQPPFPALGIIQEFTDPLQGQAVIRYVGNRVVDRPLALLTRLVPAEESILSQGVMFDPYILADQTEYQGDSDQERVT